MAGAPYTEAEVTDCLMAVVAWGGNATAAHNHLESEGKRTPGRERLSDWIRGKHAGRYNELRDKYSEQLEAQLAHEYRDVARLAVEVERKALERALEHLPDDRDPSRTAANAATVMDKSTSKLLALTGRPTSIREDRNVNEILRSLAARGVLQLPEADATATAEHGQLEERREP